jgi:hypothetical protein
VIDGMAGALGDLAPRVAVGRMEPAAAEIDGEAGAAGDRPGAATDAIARLDEEDIDARRMQGAGSTDAGGTGADDHHLDIA